MKKQISVLLLALCLILALTLFTACGKTPKPADETTAPVTEAPTEETTEAPEEATAEPVSIPTAEGGQAVQAYDVSFYLPETLTPNEWNGMLGVYDFYTGEYTGSRASGMDFALAVSDESNAGGDLEAYAIEDSRSQSGLEATPEKVELNGSTWIRLSSGDKNNYYAIFNGGLYEIESRCGGEVRENYDEAVAMLEATLFLYDAED